MSTLPCKYQDGCCFVIDEYLAVWQPVAISGLVLLSSGPAALYQLCDGKKDLSQICEVLKGEDFISEDQVEKILLELEDLEIIYWRKKIKKLFKPTKPHTLGVWMHTTNQCNLRCTYCYVHKTNASMSKQTAQQSIRAVFESAKKHGFSRIKFKYSGGEALLCLSQVITNIDYANSLSQSFGIVAEHVILTNGVLLNLRKAILLKEANVRVMISLDGTKEYHDKVRLTVQGKPTYDQVMRGIECLQEAGVGFNLSITITKDNIAGIPDLIGEMLDRNIRFVLNFFRENCESAGVELGMSNQNLIGTLNQVIDLMADNLPKYSLLDVFDRLSFSWRHENACGIGRNYITIDQNGYLAVCPTMMSHKIGHVGSDDVVEAMVDRSILQGVTVDKKTNCQNCLWRYACGGGCPILTKEVKGTYSSNSPYCEVYKAIAPRILELEARRLLRDKLSQ